MIKLFIEEWFQRSDSNQRRPQSRCVPQIQKPKGANERLK